MTGDDKAFDVLAVSRAHGVVIADDGQAYPVTNWFDEDGEECEPGEALACVSQGPEGGFFAIDLTQFEELTVH